MDVCGLSQLNAICVALVDEALYPDRRQIVDLEQRLVRVNDLARHDVKADDPAGGRRADRHGLN